MSVHVEPDDLRRRLEAAERERDELRDRLARVGEAESIALLGRGIAHDMNNVLASIMGLASLLKMDGDLPGETISDLESMVGACVRARELTQGLMGLAESFGRERDELSANDLLRLAADRCTSGIDGRARIELGLADGAPTLIGDADFVLRALESLLVNAAEAQSTPGVIRATTAEVVLDLRDVAGHPKLRPGLYVRFVVDDEGTGMDAETLRNACRPFFTTRGDGHRGLGLALVHGVARAHRGRLVMESHVDHGTRVTLDVPRATPPSDAAG